MAQTPIIITKTPPNLSGQAQVNLRKNDFDAAVWNKGTEVYIEKAMKCPCKSHGDQPLSNCLNCGGIGWFFIQKKDTRVLMMSANFSRDFKDWSEQAVGTVSITAMEDEDLTFMDRITAKTNVGLYTQVLFPKVTEDGRLFARAFYEILLVTELFLFDKANTPLKLLKRDVDFTYEGNKLFIDGSHRLEEFPSVSIRYKYNPQYHVIDMRREYITQFQRSFETGKWNRDKFPASAMARKAHYMFDQLNYFDRDDRPLELIDNSYIPDKCTPNELPPIC